MSTGTEAYRYETASQEGFSLLYGDTSECKIWFEINNRNRRLRTWARWGHVRSRLVISERRGGGSRLPVSLGDSPTNLSNEGENMETSPITNVRRTPRRRHPALTV